MDAEAMRQQLLKRLSDSYAQYRAGLLLKERQELIDEAPQIAKTAEVAQYLAEWKCSERELAYLLKFQNPLEVVADRWASCTFDLDALGALVVDMADKEAELSEYPLAPESPSESEMSRTDLTEPDCKPSIRKQLEAKSVQSDRASEKTHNTNAQRHQEAR